MSTDKPNNKKQAKLYFIKGMSPQEIADDLGLSLRTIQNYKKEAFLLGDDWNKARDRYELSPIDIVEKYFTSIQRMIEDSETNPELFATPGFADALAKHFSNVKKLKPDVGSYGLIVSFIKIMMTILQEKAPLVAEQITPHLVLIKDGCKNYLKRKSII